MSYQGSALHAPAIGYPTTAPMIMASIAALGFSIKDVNVLLNSEPHPDHAGGLGVLQQESGAELWASEASAVTLGRCSRRRFARQLIGRDESAPPTDQHPVARPALLNGGLALIAFNVTTASLRRPAW